MTSPLDKLKANIKNPRALEILRLNGILPPDEVTEPTKSHTEEWLDKFLTDSASMKHLKAMVRVIANKDENVLIYGPTGTGKEIIANALHGDRVRIQKGIQKPAPFLSINCAGLSEGLVESELFGYKRGAFTGANADTEGLCEAAEGGTLFLDEIGELPISMQSKLLRAVETNKIRRVGSTEETRISCRFVFATHTNLWARHLEGRFKDDLYWRISTFILRTTPLSSRLNDIDLLIAHMAGKHKIPYEFNEQAKEMELPGNVRQLYQMVQRYIAFQMMPRDNIDMS